MARINVIHEEEAQGELKEIYKKLKSSRGKLAEVHKILSLNPSMIVSHMDLYMGIMFGRSPLSRAQREMIGVVVSGENECEYCIEHHVAALNNYWDDNEKCRLLAYNPSYVELENLDKKICELALELTKNPNSNKTNILTSEIFDLGMDDRAIMDINLVIAYFNFVNRIVLGLGVEKEEDTGGYNY